MDTFLYITFTIIISLVRLSFIEISIWQIKWRLCAKISKQNKGQYSKIAYTWVVLRIIQIPGSTLLTIFFSLSDKFVPAHICMSQWICHCEIKLLLPKPFYNSSLIHRKSTWVTYAYLSISNFNKQVVVVVFLYFYFNTSFTTKVLI